MDKDMNSNQDQDNTDTDLCIESYKQWDKRTDINSNKLNIHDGT